MLRDSLDSLAGRRGRVLSTLSTRPNQACFISKHQVSVEVNGGRVRDFRTHLGFRLFRVLSVTSMTE